MADEQVAVGPEVPGEPSDDARPKLGVEVDEDVAAEHEIVGAADGIDAVVEVEGGEADDGAQLGADLDAALL